VLIPVKSQVDIQEFSLPELGEGVYEAELITWQVKPGDMVKRGQALMEVMTDKATMEVPSPFAGTIASLKAQPGQQIKVGDVILTFTAGARSDEKPAPVAKPQVAAMGDGSKTAPGRAKRNGPTVLAGAPGQAVKAAPSVRYMARKLGVDLAQIRGTGPEGRVLIEDLSASLAAARGAAAVQPTEAAGTRPDYGTPGTRIKLQGLRRKIAEHMVLSKRTIPHYSYIDECDVTSLVELRESLRETYSRAGVKLTYLAYFVVAAVRALKEVPIVNASLDEEAGEIVLHKKYHIGIAVATPGGLIVPVIRDADQKNLTEVAREVERLSAAARAGKTRLEDLRGSTFTLTSVGNIGGLISTPVIKHPEVGILGTGKIIKRPVYDAAGNIKPADLLFLSFSFYHRVVDGAVGAAFGNAIVRQLKNPAALLLPDPLVS
jgi:pyruvate dehydrogenase E2 component (dihydrolipoamide acetyltransferase)/2-oxoisovalerate dehydrogenase E2 component (dihydrolipoyl transacylase)